MSSGKGGRGGGGAGNKAQIKAIAEAIKGKQFDDAIEQSRDVLKSDPKNYNA